MTNDPQKESQPDTASFDEQPINRARDLLKPERETVGPYRILEKLGQGGMGEVYRAEQRQPIRREVALKLIKLGMDTKQVIARFSAERQALAMMDHPNIAKVFDAGTNDTGRPYFVMEYVKGKPITDYADEKQLSLDDRLKLFEQVCHAIQHAHHKGVIHRDLKPSNVLVSTQDGRPHAKVIDFGIAKAMNQPLTDMTLFTEHALMVGTPAYMSPEQAEGNIDIDTRSDVYSLGVLLYELLTGHTPFDPQRLKKAAMIEVARIIRDEEPPKPSTRISAIDNVALRSAKDADPTKTSSSSKSSLATLAKARCLAPESYAKQLRGELDWIVMKALDKDRKRRYSSPEDLAEDIERHLEGTTIEAAPPDIRYRAKRFIRKHRFPVIAASLVLLLVITGLAATTWQWFRADKNARLALLQKAEADNLRVAAENEQKLAKRSQRIAEEASNFLLEILSSNESGYADQVTVLQAINTAASRLESRLIEDPIVLATARSAIGRSYSRIGHWDTAREFLEKALPFLQKELGTKHPQTTRTLEELASVCLSLNDEQSAERYCIAALDRDQDPTQNASVRIVRKLAQLRLEQNNHQAALAIILALLSTLDIDPDSVTREQLQRRSLDDVQMMHLLAALADCRLLEGKIDDAERLMNVTETFFSRGGYPIQFAWTQADLGRIKLARGLWADAEALSLTALPIMEKRFGEEHFRVKRLKQDLLVAQTNLRKPQLEEH